MNKKQLKSELSKLVSKIDEYDDAYYNNNTSLVDDGGYDYEKDRLRVLAKDYNPNKESKSDLSLWIRVNDALTRVGAPPPLDGKWPKYTHEVPMGSLNKCNNYKELESWYNKCKS